MSITWTDRPSREDGQGNYRLLRVGRSGTVRGIIISHNLVGTGLHYWKGKSTPCNQSTCEACKEGHTARWYGYIALWSAKTDSIGICEITDGCADDVDRYRARHSTIRGAELLLTRQGQRPNGRILANLTPGSIADERLPSAPDVIKILMKIWGMNENHAVASRPGREKNNRMTATDQVQSGNGSTK